MVRNVKYSSLCIKCKAIMKNSHLSKQLYSENSYEFLGLSTEKA